jgi:hypothetical protein
MTIPDFLRASLRAVQQRFWEISGGGHPGHPADLTPPGPHPNTIGAADLSVVSATSGSVSLAQNPALEAASSHNLKSSVQSSLPTSEDAALSRTLNTFLSPRRLADYFYNNTATQKRWKEEIDTDSLALLFFWWGPFFLRKEKNGVRN